MVSPKVQLLDIEPKESLYFQGPFTGTVTSYILLHNKQDQTVCFKIKTTVPKRYCVRPNSGFVKPNETLKVTVILQPIEFQPQEKSKHKFMIQSMICPEVDSSKLDQVWKEADSKNIVDLKLLCILRMPGELMFNPTHTLTFDGPTIKPMTATLTLTNPNTDPVYFKFHLESTDIITASPSSATVDPNQTCTVTVKAKPLDPGIVQPPLEQLLIKSIMLKDSSDTVSADELIETPQALSTELKIVFSSLLPLKDKIKPIKQSQQMAQAMDTGSLAKKPTIEQLMDEIAALRNENKSLKESDIHLRRTALSDTCLSSAADGGAAIGRQGALGAIASVPPILYLILALFVGMILGKFAL